MKYKKLLELCRGKDIALVGNAGGIIAAKDQIDSHEVVIRLNAGVFMPDTEIRGKKVHAVFFSITGCEEEIRKRQLPGFIVSPLGKYSTEALENFESLQVDDWSAFKKIVSLDRPTTGLLTLLWVLKFGESKKITLYGFDGFKSGNFYSNRPISSSPHNISAEHDFIIDLVKNGVIEIVPVVNILDVKKSFLTKFSMTSMLYTRRFLLTIKMKIARGVQKKKN